MFFFHRRSTAFAAARLPVVLDSDCVVSFSSQLRRNYSARNRVCSIFIRSQMCFISYCCPLSRLINPYTSHHATTLPYSTIHLNSTPLGQSFFEGNLKELNSVENFPLRSFESKKQASKYLMKFFKIGSKHKNFDMRFNLFENTIPLFISLIIIVFFLLHRNNYLCSFSTCSQSIEFKLPGHFNHVLFLLFCFDNTVFQRVHRFNTPSGNAKYDLLFNSTKQINMLDPKDVWNVSCVDSS